MAAVIKPGWTKPSTILFASEIPANEKAFGFALAQAAEFGADLIIFHVLDRLEACAPEASGGRHYEYAALRAEKHRLEPLAQRATDEGIRCKIMVRQGLAADQILTMLHERKIDRVIMGAHSPGPVGKLLVGSVAEAVLRNASVPVCIVGPAVIEGTFRNSVASNILCDVSRREARQVVASMGAELAAKHNASLILQHVIPPQERTEALTDRTIDEMEAELPFLVPTKLQRNLSVQARVVLGDPTEELLSVGRARQASLIVLGAQGASHFAAVTRAATVYKVLARAHCPVMTLSPVLLAGCGAKEVASHPSEVYLAGVI